MEIPTITRDPKCKCNGPDDLCAYCEADLNEATDLAAISRDLSKGIYYRTAIERTIAELNRMADRAEILPATLPRRSGLLGTIEHDKGRAVAYAMCARMLAAILEEADRGSADAQSGKEQA